MLTKIEIPNLSDLNFKERRKATGLSLRYIEKVTGIDNSMIWRLEHEQGRNSSYETIEKLNEFYNLLLK